MNAENRKFMLEVENALGEYACACKLDGQYNVAWSEETAKAYEKLQELFLEFEERLP